MSDQSGSLADDPFSGRHPTSHERLTGLPWDASYQEGSAPWPGCPLEVVELKRFVEEFRPRKPKSRTAGITESPGSDDGED